MVQVYLTRRNLLTLLAKLDGNIAKRKGGKAGLISKCTIIKNDTENKMFPQSQRDIFITAVEDAEYYTDRKPGIMAEEIVD